MDKPELFAEYAALCISLDNQLYIRQREKELEIQKTYTRRENAQSHRFSNISMPLNSSSPNPASPTLDTNWLDNVKAERAARKALDGNMDCVPIVEIMAIKYLHARYFVSPKSKLILKAIDCGI